MPYASVTLAQLRVFLGQRWEDVPFWTVVDADLAINDALRVWAVLTGYWRYTASATQVGNDPWITLAAPLAQGVRLSVGNYALEPTTLEGLDHGSPVWQSARGTPAVWAPVDLQTIVVAPASAVNLLIAVDGLRETPVLIAPGDFVQLGAEEQSAVLDYALHAAAFKMGAVFLQATQPHYDRFAYAAGLRNGQLLESLAFREAYLRGQRLLRAPEAVAPAEAQS